jgi:hypothetical protein
MQKPTAGAPGFPARNRKVFIKFQKEFIKAGICKQRLIQRIASFTLAGKGDKKPLRKA